jgi:Tfp pilus assembly major pilin PilA
MLKKLLVFAITSGLAAKLYKSYTEKQAASRAHAARAASRWHANGGAKTGLSPQSGSTRPDCPDCRSS